MTASPGLFRAARPELPDNECRFRGGPGHVESYFWRANDPSRPRALWLKQTILAPLKGPAVAESWFIWFDAEAKRTIAGKATQPFERARFFPDAVTTDAMSASPTAPGHARGAVSTPEGDASFDLAWTVTPSPVARRLSILPYRLLREGPFPKAKLLTPYPSLDFTGVVTVAGERVDVGGWRGMQGHNWGKEHTFEYVWGQCLFPDDDVMCEGFSARVKIAGGTTPRLSALVVSKGARTFRFDRLFDPWRQKASIDGDRWTLELRSDDGEASLSMDASQQPMVCLGYDNPNGERSYCLNSKLAKVSLRVRPSDDASFTVHSAHGGALEFLKRQPDPRFSRVV